GKLTAIVVSKRLVNRQYDLFTSGTGHIWVTCDMITSDDSVASCISIVNIKIPFCRVIGRKGNTQQTLFTAEAYTVMNIEKRSSKNGVILDNTDIPRLFNDKQAAASVSGMCNVDRMGKVPWLDLEEKIWPLTAALRVHIWETFVKRQEGQGTKG